MDAKSSTIAAFLRENKQYVAPVYQRNYAWLAEKQCQVLWNDLLSLTSNAKSKHFLGSVVIIKLDDSLGRNFVIDGQQRLTTIQLLLIAMRDYVRECRNTDQNEASTWSEKSDDFIDAIEALIFNNSNECKLELNADDNKVFLNLAKGLSHGTMSGYDKSTNVFLNYNYFLEKIKNKTNNNGFLFDELLRLYQSLINDIELALIVLENYDSPQRVFESLNSTGLDLQASDLIRNYVLMSADGNEEHQKELYDKYWHPFEQLFPPNDSTHLTNFFTNLVVLKQLVAGIKDKDLAKPYELYDTFKYYYSNDKEIGALKYAPELLHYGICYARIMGWQKNEDEQLSLIFDDINWLQSSSKSPLYALVLYLYYCYQSNRNDFGYQQFLQACRYIVSAMVRRAVCSRNSQPTRKLREILFYNLANTDNLSEQLNINFSIALNCDFFPKDTEFEHSIKTIPLYKTNTTLHLCSFVLTRLAGMNLAKDKPLENMSVEHILPQNNNLNESWQRELGDDWKGLQDIWLHRLGNLTLSFNNSELGDKPFAEKLVFYRDSNIAFLNDFIVKCEHWTPEQIEERGKLLAEKSIALWPIPRTVDVSNLKNKSKSRKRKTKSLNDYCGTSEILLKVLKEINIQIKNSWGGLPEFKCSMNTNLIEYTAYSTTLAIVQPDDSNNVIKLWFHCSYDELPSKLKKAVSLSNDWVSWNGCESFMKLDPTVDDTKLDAIYFTLGKVLEVVKIQFDHELILV